MSYRDVSRRDLDAFVHHLVNEGKRYVAQGRRAVTSGLRELSRKREPHKVPAESKILPMKKK